MHRLREELENTGIEISDAEWKSISLLFKAKAFKKGETIHYAGDIMNTVYYISSGVGKSYFLDQDGKEFIWQIYFNEGNSERKNFAMDDCVSYYEQEGSLLSFDALEDMQCYCIAWLDLESLYSSDIKWQFLGRMLTHQAYAISYKRVISMMSESASERYERLIVENPAIFEQVKSYHIAAYLGITPQSLSRLRKKLP